MPRRKDIDDILADWSYQPDDVAARRVPATNAREVLQMRVDMGLLQMEVDGRPDGSRPHGAITFFDYLRILADQQGEDFELTPQQCFEADREFVQFYHRRICWLALREFEKAMRDADHTLSLMDFCRDHSPDEAWTMSHEQYRPFVLFHRTQSATLRALEEEDAEAAIEAVNLGLIRLHELCQELDDNELVTRLIELRESVREKFDVGRTLQEQLSDAIASEQYELAARLRDKLADRRHR